MPAGTHSPRILIVKLTAVGDVVHAMPVACALRRRFPNATIGWLAEGHCARILRGHEAIDRLFVTPRHWSESLTTILALRERLRPHRFDIAIDLQGLTKSAGAAWLSGARRRIGFAGSVFLDIGRWFVSDLAYRTFGREASRWVNNVLVHPRPGRVHVVDQYLELLRPLGIVSPEVEFKVPRQAAAERRIDEVLAGMSLGGGFAVINPGAGKQSKLWVTDRAAAVARRLADRHGLPTVVVWARGAEQAWAREIVDAAGAPARLAPETSLPELAALARRARLFVACDTGPLHIAAAVGTPCVGLFGTMPAWRNGPYGPQHAAIQKAQLTGPSWRRHHADNHAMLAIAAEDVCNACDWLLAPPGPRGP